MLLKIFWTAVNAVFPLVILIMLGYFLKRTGFLSQAFIRGGNKLVFTVLLPCVLFYNIYGIPSFMDINWPAVLFGMVGVTALLFISFGIAVAATPVPARRGVISQCVFRSNFSIIGLTLASALGGDEAMSVAAVISAFTIPLFNVYSVIALTVFSPEGKAGRNILGGTLRKILRNPMIIGSLLGMAVLLLRGLEVRIFGYTAFSIREDIPFLYKALENLKSITTPFALLILGAEFEFSAIRGMFREVAVGTVSRLVAAPLLAIVTAWLLSSYTGLISFGVNEYASLIALFGSPVAVSSVAMAEQMDGDAPLATQLVVWTSVFSILTIFLQVCILMAVGLI